MPVVTTTGDQFDNVALPTRIEVQQGGTLKAGDTRPALTATLTDAEGEPVPLGGVREITFVMASEGRDEATAVGPADILDLGTGAVRYAWNRKDTATAQTYQIEFEIEYNDGQVITVPTDGYGSVTIQPRIVPRATRRRQAGRGQGGGGQGGGRPQGAGGRNE